MDGVIIEDGIDSNHEPTQEELEEYAEYIGIDMETEGHLMWIAKKGLQTPLPKNWKPCQTEDGMLSWEHPCDPVFKEMVEEERLKRTKTGFGNTKNEEDVKVEKIETARKINNLVMTPKNSLKPPKAKTPLPEINMKKIEKPKVLGSLSNKPESIAHAKVEVCKIEEPQSKSNNERIYNKEDKPAYFEDNKFDLSDSEDETQDHDDEQFKDIEESIIPGVCNGNDFKSEACSNVDEKNEEDLSILSILPKEEISIQNDSTLKLNDLNENSHLEINEIGHVKSGIDQDRNDQGIENSFIEIERISSNTLKEFDPTKIVDELTLKVDEQERKFVELDEIVKNCHKNTMEVIDSSKIEFYFQKSKKEKILREIQNENFVSKEENNQQTKLMSNSQDDQTMQQTLTEDDKILGEIKQYVKKLEDLNLKNQVSNNSENLNTLAKQLKHEMDLEQQEISKIKEYLRNRPIELSKQATSFDDYLETYRKPTHLSAPDYSSRSNYLRNLQKELNRGDDLINDHRRYMNSKLSDSISDYRRSYRVPFNPLV
ncbi:hypothetical protein ROZALSC1DRAFT_29101 [Rozella allomycis CSF55]|uniref:WW domain-containing protein n=1 Tax=Rozella allomycis (strain CSF55) TaxID=988480 RepID=A0A075AU18_ROZAC|nr:hypothetical protein O9G_002562 [Rozella allomycis CSF55]RKP19278.1 hypothetical protein ROZALSC1DRAFT_29101 [Rozella allomycis CSF55]|eukprot:EPZ32210.1 hypothetical protein O9G_002562 [Rozella allomycis CSF55]